MFWEYHLFFYKILLEKSLPNKKFQGLLEYTSKKATSSVLIEYKLYGIWF